MPVQQEMEAAIATRAGAPYKARKVTFHLPDFIDIVLNAGDDRDPLGATIGQSLPNWGPVANEGRGRTVAMVNLYHDPDSVAARRAQAESVLDAGEHRRATPATHEPGLLDDDPPRGDAQPRPRARVQGRRQDRRRGVRRPASRAMMEELKAQTGALFLLELLRAKELDLRRARGADVRRRDRVGVRPHLAGHVHRRRRAQDVQQRSPRSRSAT